MEHLAYVYAAPASRGRLNHGVRFHVPKEALYSKLLLRELHQAQLCISCEDPKEAQAHLEEQHGEANYQVIGAIRIAFAGVAPAGVVDPLMTPEAGELCQAKYWDDFWPDQDLEMDRIAKIMAEGGSQAERPEPDKADMHSQRRFVKIDSKASWTFTQPVKVRASTGELDGTPRSTIFELSMASARNLQALLAQCMGVAVDKVACSTLAVRVPLPHALLLVSAAWTRYIFPILQGHRRFGLSHLKQRWQDFHPEFRGRAIGNTSSSRRRSRRAAEELDPAAQAQPPASSGLPAACLVCLDACSSIMPALQTRTQCMT